MGFREEWSAVPELPKAHAPQKQLVSTLHPPSSSSAALPLAIRETFPSHPYAFPHTPGPAHSPAVLRQSPPPSRGRRTPAHGFPSQDALMFTPQPRQLSPESSFNRFHTISPSPATHVHIPSAGQEFIPYLMPQGQNSRVVNVGAPYTVPGEGALAQAQHYSATRPDNFYVDQEERMQKGLTNQMTHMPPPLMADTFFQDQEQRLQRELERQTTPRAHTQGSPRKPNNYYVDQEQRLQDELSRHPSTSTRLQPPPKAPSSTGLGAPSNAVSALGRTVSTIDEEDETEEVQRKRRQSLKVQQFLMQERDQVPASYQAPTQEAAAPQLSYGAPQSRLGARDQLIQDSIRAGETGMLYATSIYPGDRNLGKEASGVASEAEVRREEEDRMRANAAEQERLERGRARHLEARAGEIEQRIRALQDELDVSQCSLEVLVREAESNIANEVERSQDSREARQHIVAWDRQTLAGWRQIEENFATYAQYENKRVAKAKRTMVHYLTQMDENCREMSETIQGLLLIDRELEDALLKT